MQTHRHPARGRRLRPLPILTGVPLLAATLAAAGPGALRQEPAPGAPPVAAGIEWPTEGAVSAIFATLPPGRAGAAPALDWPTAAEAWTDGGPYGAWARALAAAADDAADDAAAGGAARCRLALTALRQGRHDDAWRHAAGLARVDADAARALLARFVPGAPPGTEVEADGRVAPLADGVLLTPSLPPPTDPAPGRLDVREIFLRGLRIGAAELDLQLGVRGDGVELRFEHVAGGACEFAISIPCPSGFRTRVEYANWAKLTTVGEPVPVRLAPGDEPFKLWARTELEVLPWPQLLPASLDARARASGLVLAVDDDDPDRAAVVALAGALEALLAVPCVVAAEHDADAPGPLSPLRIDLVASEGRAARIAALCGDVERFVLGAP